MVIVNGTDIIFALATPPGISGVAVLRISGEGAVECFRAFGVVIPMPRVAVLQSWYDGCGTLIDKGIAIYFPAPRSFTGEDVVELHLHGGRAVISHMLDSLARIPGFRPAQAGEFTRRALENGKMDLLQAEGLLDLLHAETERQKSLAQEFMGEGISAIYTSMRRDIIEITALIEAYIDFPDEDIPESVLSDISRRTREFASHMRQMLGSRRGQRIRDGLSCVIMGAPNAGKSSLLNYLAASDVAIVCDIPGTTRDVIRVPLNISGFPVVFADTAGLREQHAVDDIEREGMRRTMMEAQKADISLLVVDCSDPVIPDIDVDIDAVIWNKSDISQARISAYDDKRHFGISAKHGDGVGELLEFIGEKAAEIAGNGEDDALSRAIVNQRQRTHVVSAKVHIDNFLAMLDRGGDMPEIMAEELRRAAYEIGSITGMIDVEDVLNALFSQFCIGK